MKGRVIVLDTPQERGFAAALMVDGQLEDVLLDPLKGRNLPNSGDIGVARVRRKLPKAGAFCEMAGGTEGFLKNARDVREGDRILAQVVSLPEPGKAVTLTTRLLIKGPRLILSPGAPGVNVSRKIGNEAERARLEKVVTEALSADFAKEAEKDTIGIIVRTSARGEADRALESELGWLFANWDNRRAYLRSGERVLGQDGNTLQTALREWLFPRPNAILCSHFLAKVMNEFEEDSRPICFYGDESFLPLMQSDPDPFEAAGVHDAMRALASPEVPLGSATMIIEPTRTLVAVDVNTGGDFSPAAGLKANQSAARELPRQLRLRGLGGQIAVDFAPMPKKDRRTLEEALKKAFRADPVETALIGWTAMGLYEMQRKRERRPLSEVWTP